MRLSRIAAAALLSACATTPAPAPVAAPAPAPAAAAAPAKAAPFEITALETAEQALLSTKLKLVGRVQAGAGVQGFDWTARWTQSLGEKPVMVKDESGNEVAATNPYTGEAKTAEQFRTHDLGGGHVAIAVGGDGTFAAEIPLTFGDGPAALETYKDEETIEVVVQTTAKGAAGDLQHSRSARVRVPKLPSVYILSVQAGRQSADTLDLVYLLAVKNPNVFDVRASTLNYTARVADRVIAGGELPLSTRIPGSTENTFEIPATANVDNFGRDLAARIKANDLDWSFAGTMKISGIEIPMELQGPLKLSQ